MFKVVIILKIYKFSKTNSVNTWGKFNYVGIPLYLLHHIVYYIKCQSIVYTL